MVLHHHYSKNIPLKNKNEMISPCNTIVIFFLFRNQACLCTFNSKSDHIKTDYGFMV